jgi:RimJ/RimL family protein N-acetyltransferase
VVPNGLPGRAGDQPLSIEDVAAFVQARIPHCRPFDGHIAARPIFLDGEMIAAVVWHNYDAWSGNVEVAIAADSPRWIGRERLEVLFHFPFIAMGCRRITARISTANVRSRKLCKGLGFQLEGLMRKASPDGNDMLIYGLLKEECKFLRKEWLE